MAVVEECLNKLNLIAPPAPNSAGLGGAGGAGATSSITGSPVARAGGGGS